MIDSSYFELEQNGGQKLNEDWNSCYISIQLPYNEAKCKAQQQLLNL